ncbi:MAG: hypothetical protein V4517_19475 [Pseudomonadota bacterium]
MRRGSWIVGALLTAVCFYIFVIDTIPFVSFDRPLKSNEILFNGPPNSYYVANPIDPAYPLSLGPDRPNNRNATLIILEDGRPLGPAHSSHKEIAELGAGRYSHWKGTADSVLVFSSSDNTDPRTNGRTYTLSRRVEIPVSFLVLVVLPLTIFLMRRTLTPRWIETAQTALAAVVFLAWARLIFGYVAISYDSATYLGWSPLVPLGYPFFLSAVGSLVWVPIVQLLATSTACLLVGFAMNRISQAAGLATVIILFSYTPMFFVETGILSEALFVPLLLANLGAALFLISEPKRRYAVAVAATAVAVMFVRPAGYFAPLGITFLAIALKTRFRWALKWAVAPLACFLIVTILINLAIRGNTAQSQIGRVLFPHIAFLFEPEYAATADREYALTVAQALLPHRARYDAALSLAERVAFSTNNYNTRLSDTDFAIYRRFAADDIAARGSTDSATYFRRLDKIYRDLFFQTVLNRPVGYLMVVRDQLVGAWQSAVMLSTAPFREKFKSEAINGSKLRTELIEAWKLPISKDPTMPNLAALDQWPGHIIAFLDVIFRRIQSQQWLIYMVGVVTFLAIPLAFLMRGSRHWCALGFCGAMIHGSMLLTSTTTVFLPRYALPIEPLILVAGVIMVDGLLSWAQTAMCKGVQLAQTYRGRTAE